MSVEKNRALAVRFLTTMRDHGGLDESLITDDFAWWASYHHGLMNAAEIKAMVAGLTQMPRLPEMIVTGTVAEGDKVSVEVAGKCTLPDGRPYNNFYHFVILLRDGRICMVREYTDTKLASDTFGGVDLAEVTRKSAGHA
jgi:ketosteroid isomerase-like protein